MTYRCPRKSDARHVTYTYDPYGNATPSRTGIINPFQYAGQLTDPTTGLIYMRARWYDPDTGRFLTRDPLEALTRSAYGYVSGNPLNSTDPTGLSECGQFSLGGIIDCGAKVSPVSGQDTADFAGGVLDTVTLGHAKDVLKITGAENNVNYESDAYAYGKWAGYAPVAVFALEYPVAYVGLSMATSFEDTLRTCIGHWDNVCLATAASNAVFQSGTMIVGGLPLIGPYLASSLSAFGDVFNSSYWNGYLSRRGQC